MVDLAALVKYSFQRQVDNTEQGVVFVYTSITNGNVYFGIANISNEALAASVEEWLRVLRLGARFEDFLVIENDGAICRG